MVDEKDVILTQDPKILIQVLAKAFGSKDEVVNINMVWINYIFKDGKMTQEPEVLVQSGKLDDIVFVDKVNPTPHWLEKDPMKELEEFDKEERKRKEAEKEMARLGLEKVAGEPMKYPPGLTSRSVRPKRPR